MNPKITRICIRCKNNNFFGDQADIDGICASCRCPFCEELNSLKDICKNCNNQHGFYSHVVDFYYDRLTLGENPFDN